MVEKFEKPSPQPVIKNKKFSLWDWLVIVAIIIGCIWLLWPSLEIHTEKGKNTKTEATIAAIESALAMYENDTGRYPEDEYSNWESIDVLAWRLTGKQPGASATDSDITITGNSKWLGPYIKGIEKDPWGEYYYYTNNKKDVDGTNKQVGVLTGDKVPVLPYYIYSKGQDKATGLGNNADDITSWDANRLWDSSYHKR